mmetsp:Transcript_106754/g.284015  ORF Transcript_106754/g.284015 Transcript_106754/m.284015 type:complete len:221 (+) Transcript_106754:504-1166(+)
MPQEEPQNVRREATSPQLPRQPGSRPASAQPEASHCAENVRREGRATAAGTRQLVCEGARQGQPQPEATSAELLHAVDRHASCASPGHDAQGLLQQLQRRREPYRLDSLVAPDCCQARPEPQQRHRVLLSVAARAQRRQDASRGLFPELPAMPLTSEAAECPEAGVGRPAERDRAQVNLDVGRYVEVVKRRERAEVPSDASSTAPSRGRPPHGTHAMGAI